MNASLLWLLMASEWRQHPWRHGMALLAVALGVALAFSVHLVNSSALAEFSTAVRAANGDPDLVLRGPRSGLDDALFDRVVADPAVAIASPVLEVDTHARAADGRRLPLRVLGLDLLRAAPLTPELVPRPAAGEDRLVFLDPDAGFVNPAARALLALQDGGALDLQSGPAFQRLRVAGSVAASGSALAVIDIAAAQQRFGALGRLSRIDLRLRPGADVPALLARLKLPPGVNALPADEAEQRVSQLSRAYRVNLSVLALVALFVGSFLVFSVVSLSVAQRTPALALLGVLGLGARQRRALVLIECTLLGAAGSALGLLLGTAMAALALRWLAGDLGGGFFPGITPRLHSSLAAPLLFGLLGLAAALVGGWLPARQAERMAPAQALKGLGDPGGGAPPAWPGLALLALGSAAAFAPPLAGLPIAAYAAVAAILFGGVALVPVAVSGLLRLAPAARGALSQLALQRARFQRRAATAAVAGVVASLALSVALTVMVASFRDGVSQWLTQVLPADLYARTAASSAGSEQAWLPSDFALRAAALPGVEQVVASRTLALALAPGNPPVTLIARPLPRPAAALPLVAPPLTLTPAQDGEVGVYVSEAVLAIYGAAPGSTLTLALETGAVEVRVLGVWRDYARQFGSIAMASADYQRLSGDTRINELALTLSPGADAASVQLALRALLSDPQLLQFAASDELRAMSFRIFDRSFAVTYYLQAVAIVIGLVGISASLSAQVLARRKEFGLLSHLGLTRRQVVALVTGEAAAWVAAGTLLGLVLGLAVSLVLVYVVNPQSFHWTMELVLPLSRLAALCAAVWVAGVATAAFSARGAASRSALLSVKEDW